MIRKTFLTVLMLGVTLSGYSSQRDSIPSRVLILGNSITWHGAKASVGWAGNWGMAASSAEKDYVHLLESRIKNDHPNTSFKAGNIAATFERQFWNYNVSDFKDFSDFNADLILLVIGENINDAMAVKNGLDHHLEQLVRELSTGKKPKVCLVGSFWPNQHIDQIMKTTAERNNWLYVDLQGLYQERNKNTAIQQYADKGVGMHPSDLGMEGIADRIWNGIQDFFRNQE
ncbi:SGNH/GDSL hydrolase family protein [Pedobacter sp. FW305-3-2-15-E-R2A2]|uniref:SGNH/GDSL hydrolase family protein n=1 Tax=Pedobacter sp. FW305-3-2-15-E-R2A2 TaxID=3140251 RepID=UPI0031404D70